MVQAIEMVVVLPISNNEFSAIENAIKDLIEVEVKGVICVMIPM